MTRIIKRITQILIILIFIIRPLYAQKKEFGLSLGYGKTEVEYDGRPFMHPFSNVNSNFVEFGLGFYYTPINSVFSVSSGLNYIYRGNSDIKLNYLRTPVGLDLSFGKKFNFKVGGGIYGSILIWDSGVSLDSDFHETKKTIQFGWYGNVGFGIQITQIYSLEILFRQYSDITKMYEYHRMSPGGSPYSLDQKGYDGLIRVCLKYNIK